MGRRTWAVVAFLSYVSPLAGAASDYSTLDGEWHGQAQFHASVGKQHDPAAHFVTNLSIVIEQGGKLVGASPANGCRVLGLATPSGPKSVVNLDITLSGCSYPGFNRRFSGNLFLYPRERYASLRLRSFTVNKGPKQENYDIRATLKR